MATNSGRNHDSDRFQFGLKTLLLGVTAVCVILAILQWILPESLSVEARIAVSGMIVASIAYLAWAVYQAKRYPWKAPEDYVTVKVDAKWMRRVKSP